LPWGSDLPTRRHAEESRPVLKTIQGRSVSAARPISFHVFSRSVATTMRPWRVGAAMNAATNLGQGKPGE
jgi:hypothetical protein